MSFQAILRALAVAVLALLAGGCGDRMVPIKGTVTLDGKPLAKATVMFSAEGDTRPATAVTDENGAFVLTTNQPGDGVMRGEYKVVIINSDNYIEVPRATGAPAHDGPAFDAHKKAVEDMRKRPPKKGTLPTLYSSPQTTPLRWRVPEDGTEAVFDLKSDASEAGK